MEKEEINNKMLRDTGTTYVSISDVSLSSCAGCAGCASGFATAEEEQPMAYRNIIAVVRCVW